MATRFHEGLQNANTIRLLRIARFEDNTIRIELTQVGLDDKPDFDCLSYVWGQLVFSVVVHNQYGVLNITPTLASTLKRLFELGHRRPLWADGICIDQTNHVERVQQVQLMRQIYSQAKTVIADLGESFEYSDEAVDLCKTIATRNRQPQSITTLFGNSISSFPSDLPSIYEHCWTGFRRLIAQPWFTRVWIIQEYLVAKQVSMLCGQKLFDASLVFDAMRYVYDNQLLGYDKRVYTESRYNVEFTSASTAASYLTMLLNQKLMLARGHEILLSTFLQRGILFGATDPRDRLYAIANLVKLEKSSDTTPDYKADPSLVYQRLFRHLAHTDLPMLIELLHAVGQPRSDPPSPTWLPDWTTKSASQSLELFRRREFGEMPRPIFRAGIMRSRKKTPILEVKLSEDMKTLSTRGIIVDTIEYVCYDLFKQLDNNISNNTARASILTDWLNEVLALAAIARADEDAVWRTLIANVTSTDRTNSQQMSSVPPASFVAHFNMFKQYVLGLDSDPEIDDDKVTASAASFLTTMGYVMRGRVFGITRSGRLCLAPSNAEKGDVVVILLGAAAPFFVRLTSVSNAHEMLGHGYVHGLMRGEALRNEDSDVIMLHFV